jgi:hypothetical protein
MSRLSGETLFYGSLGLLGIMIVCAIIFFFTWILCWTRTNFKMDEEYGKQDKHDR